MPFDDLDSFDDPDSDRAMSLGLIRASFGLDRAMSFGLIRASLGLARMDR